MAAEPLEDQAKAEEDFQVLVARFVEQVRELPDGPAALAAIDPAQVDADYEQAWQLLDSQEMELALEAFGNLAQRVPDQHRVQFGFALCLQSQGLIDEALRHYSMAFVLDPSSAACAFRLGECLLAHGDQEDAREALLTAIELSALEGQDPNIALYAQETLDLLTSGSL